MRRPQTKPKDKDPTEEFRLARPVPSKRNYVPTPEEWASWCSQPCTEWVAAVFAAKARECRDLWAEQSWKAGAPDPNLLIELRTRADNFEAFLQSNWKDYNAATATR